MKFSVIREFLFLASNKNYTKTAEQLYIAQSTLSRHVAALEDELGVQLISRSTSTFQLTPAGKLAEEEFGKILGRYQRLTEKLSQMNGDIEGELRLGILYYDMDAYVTRIANAFRERHPKVKLRLYSYQPLALEEALMKDQIDVGITYGLSLYQGNDIDWLSFLRCSFTAIMDSGNELADRKEVFAEDLRDKVVVRMPKMRICGDNKMQTMMFEEAGVACRLIETYDNADELPNLLRRTRGVTIGLALNDTMWNDRVVKIPFETERYSSDVSAFWKRENTNAAIPLLKSTIKSCFP